MAEFVDGKWICGVISPKTGLPCRAILAGDGPIEERRCIHHTQTNIVVHRGGGDVIRSYDNLLPEYIRKHYDENDDTLLSLKPKVAILDSFLRRKLELLNEVDGGANWKEVVKLVQKLKVTPLPEHALPIVDALSEVIKRAETETVLETDIRNLIQEMASATKQEVGQMLAMNQLISVDNVIALVRELHAVAIQYCQSTSDTDNLTRAFHNIFKRNTDNNKGK